MSKLVAQISASVSVARRYGRSCDITRDLSIMDALTDRFGMDTSSVEAFIRNGPSGRWTITCGRIVAVTLAGLYFAGRGRVVAVTCRDPILVRIVLLESSSTIEGIKLPFPERGLELLSDCVGEELTWEAKYLRPYASMISDTDCSVGNSPIPMLEDLKPIEQFLTLKERIEVALLVSDDAGMRCAGIEVINKCSPRGVWCGFLVPHNFFVVVIVTKVSTECQGQIAYCEEESMTTLGALINRRVLWSRYKVRPTEPLCPSRDSDVKEERIGGPPIPFPPDMEDQSGSDSDINTTTPADNHGGQSGGAPDKVDHRDAKSANEYPDQPLWRGRIFDLLNDDLSFFGKAKILVCLPDKPFDEKNLGDTDVRVLFLSDGDLQMTSFCWPLEQVRLEGGRLLLEIVTWCSEHGESSGDDSGLDGVRKNPYRHIKRRKLSLPFDSKLKWKLSDVQRVSSLRCCKFRCCQTFSWDDMLALRRKFYGSTFEVRREIAYAVQGQLHSLPKRRKKFMTLCSREVCENAWYTIHGVCRSAYHKYKAAALAGRVNGMHGNSGITRPRPHTIQAEANFMTIIQENADRIPNEFRNIGRKRVNNLLVLLSALNWDHMRDISNSVLHSF